jgi:hypothetical protein
VSLVAAIRAAYGTALLAVPRSVLSVYGASPGDDTAVVVARVLGARHLLQGLVQRRGRAPRLGAMVDLVHAASMFALASVGGEHRRPALIDGTIATGFAGGMLLGKAPRNCS